jgi:CheY-like chemotaxis protein
MPAIVICSSEDLGTALESTVLWRQDFERHFAGTLDEGRGAVAASHPAIVLLDRDLPWAADLVKSIRRDATGERCAITVVARGDFEDAERELLQAGANAVLRLPPDEEWDRRLAHLLQLSARRNVRVPVRLELEATLGAAEEPFGAATVDVSETGMAIESPSPLGLGRELDFTFVIPGTSTPISGRARVARVASDHAYGLEFTDLDGDAVERLRNFLQTSLPTP